MSDNSPPVYLPRLQKTARWNDPTCKAVWSPVRIVRSTNLPSFKLNLLLPAYSDDFSYVMARRLSSSPSDSSSHLPIHDQVPGPSTSNFGFFPGASNFTANNGIFNDVAGNQVTNVTETHYNFQNSAAGIAWEMEENACLDRLPHTKGAGYSSGDRKSCMEGTRNAVLQEIESWEMDTTTNSVYWLKGIAGTGKTVIAQTFAERSAANGRLGASFFCSRDFPGRRNIRLIFPTLAYYLAYQYISFKASLVQIIRSSPDVEHESLAVQLEKFLVRPLKSTKLSITIVVDALDECEDREPVSAILSVLARYVDEIPFVKFFITGRPEDRIRSGFEIPSLRTKELPLDDVEPTSINLDIELYVNTRLEEIATRKRHSISGSWPSQKDTAAICRKSSGLFLVASIIVDFIDQPHTIPQDRLKMIIGTLDSTVYAGKSRIDATYHQVYAVNFKDVDSPQFFDQLRLVVGSIVLAFKPLSRISLARVLETSPEKIWMILSSLHSILVVPESDSQLMRICHKSLADFLTDPRRCTEPRYYIDALALHLELGTRCLKLMNRTLKKNICCLPRYAMNHEIEDLPALREKHIGTALAYACGSWAKHFLSSLGAEVDMGSIVELVKYFFEHHFLSWLEVLSVEGNLGVAIHSLHDVKVWLTDSDINDSGTHLLNMIDDCEKFVLRFFDVMEVSAPHIYSSALPWSPTLSLTRALYSSQLMTEAKVNPVDSSWDACIRTISAGVEVPQTILFSNNGALMAICGENYVKILDAVTGVALAELMVHSTTVSAAFSSDDALLGCGSNDGRIMVFDLQTSNLIRTVAGNIDGFWSVSFSPCGTMIVGGHNETIQIWNIHSGDRECVLESHFGWVEAVCWSAIENRVISGSTDTTVRVWDVSTGACSMILRNHTDRVTRLAVSPDSNLFASGSDDKRVIIYDSRSCDVLWTISASDKVLSVQFSPLGEAIMYTGESCGFIRDFTKKTDVSTIRYVGEAATFSPDGTCIAALSGGFVKVWKYGSNHEAPCYSTQVASALFAPNGLLVASQSRRGAVIKILDVTTGVCSATLHYSEGAVVLDNPIVLSFSRNSEFIVCLWGLVPCDRRPTVRMWNVYTRSTVGTLMMDYDTRSVAPSSDGSRLLSLSQSHVGRRYDIAPHTAIRLAGTNITLWDFATGTRLAFLSVEPLLGHRVAFAPDETVVCMDSGTRKHTWRILPAPTSSDPPFDNISLIFVPLPEERWNHQGFFGTRSPYHLFSWENWISGQDGQPVFWVPPDRKRGSLATISHGKKIAVVDKSRRLYIVDFSDVPTS